MPQIEINVSCDNCDFIRTYYNDMPNIDDILEDFYNCSNCETSICVQCICVCENCLNNFCENCYKKDNLLCDGCNNIENTNECPECSYQEDKDADHCSNCGYKPKTIVSTD